MKSAASAHLGLLLSVILGPRFISALAAPPGPELPFRLWPKHVLPADGQGPTGPSQDAARRLEPQRAQFWTAVAETMAEPSLASPEVAALRKTRPLQSWHLSADTTNPPPLAAVRTAATDTHGWVGAITVAGLELWLRMAHWASPNSGPEWRELHLRSPNGLVEEAGVHWARSEVTNLQTQDGPDRAVYEVVRLLRSGAFIAWLRNESAGQLLTPFVAALVQPDLTAPGTQLTLHHRGNTVNALVLNHDAPAPQGPPGTPRPLYHRAYVLRITRRWTHPPAGELLRTGTARSTDRGGVDPAETSSYRPGEKVSGPRACPNGTVGR